MISNLRNKEVRMNYREWFASGKPVCIMAFLVILLIPMLSAARSGRQDVIYLKNGSIIRGEIIEQVPNDYIKIETSDGSVFVYYVEDIEKITKEQPVKSSSSYSVSDSPMGSKAFQFNPLGLLQFGPIFEGQFEVSPNMYLTAHWRYSSLGLLYHLIATDGFENDATMGCMAIGAGFLKFLERPNSDNRFYVGTFVEYGWGKVNNSSSPDDKQWETTNSQFIAMASFGYRWRYPSQFILNVGVMAGGFLGLKEDKIKADEPDIVYKQDAPAGIIAMLELSMGWEF